MRSGVPAVGGISTQAITAEAIAGELDGGASAGEAAEDLGPDTGAVRRAQGYELSQRAALGPRAAQVRTYGRR